MKLVSEARLTELVHTYKVYTTEWTIVSIEIVILENHVDAKLVYLIPRENNEFAKSFRWTINYC